MLANYVPEMRTQARLYKPLRVRGMTSGNIKQAKLRANTVGRLGKSMVGDIAKVFMGKGLQNNRYSGAVKMFTNAMNKKGGFITFFDALGLKDLL